MHQYEGCYDFELFKITPLMTFKKTVQILVIRFFRGAKVLKIGTQDW